MLQKVLEEEMIGRLPSSRPLWMRVLGRLAQISQAAVKEKDDVLQTKMDAVRAAKECASLNPSDSG